MEVRPYQSEDYDQVAALYKQSESYGGQFDEARDTPERLSSQVTDDPESILVAVDDDTVKGTVTLFEDGRTALLWRFAVQHGDAETEVTKALADKGLRVLKGKGHTQVLVFTPVRNKHLDERYEKLGFNRGNDYTCFWTDV